MARTFPSKSSPLWLKLCPTSGHNPTFLITFHILSRFSFTSVSPPHTLGNNSSRSWTQRPFSTGGGMMTNSLTSTHRPLELRQKTVLVSAVERSCWVSVGCDVFRCEVVVKIYELLAAFSLLGELGEEEEEEEGEKFIPDNPGGSVAVFCPLRLFLHTGHVSCCSSHGTIQSLWNKWLHGSCLTLSSTL